MPAVAQDFELAVLEDVELAGAAALLDQGHAGGDPVAAEPGSGHGGVLSVDAQGPDPEGPAFAC